MGWNCVELLWPTPPLFASRDAAQVFLGFYGPRSANTEISLNCEQMTLLDLKTSLDASLSSWPVGVAK
jgi:hypothetical protein